MEACDWEQLFVLYSVFRLDLFVGAGSWEWEHFGGSMGMGAIFILQFLFKKIHSLYGLNDLIFHIGMEV